MDKTELIRAMESAHASIAAAAATLSDEALIAEAPGMPGWTRKDVLAHIEFWHDHSTSVLTSVRSGVDPHPAGDEPFDINTLNARVLADNRDRPGADVREGEAASFVRLRAAVEHASEHELFDAGVVPWFEGAIAEMIAGDTYDHYPEHLPHLAAG